MKRNKYINTFDTTAEYENYIESAAAGFPNVALTKDNDKVNYMSMSPNEHVIYGTLNDASLTNAVWINNTNDYGNNGIVINVHNDVLNNTFYLDASDFTSSGISSITSLKRFRGSLGSNVISIKKISFDTSNVTSMSFMFQNCSSLTSLDLSTFDTSNVTTMYNMFDGCSSLTSLDLSTFDTSNVTSTSGMFQYCSSLTDVYITVEATLNKFTNNLTSESGSYIPSNNGNCTIHYNDVDYKWQNNRWTPQS